MTVKICARCQVRYTIPAHTGDYIHNCGDLNRASEVLKNEDVVIISTTVDEFGDKNKSTGKLQGDILYQGVENQFWGTRAQIEGEDFEGVTSRGARSKTHRSRPHFAYKPAE